MKALLRICLIGILTVVAAVVTCLAISINSGRIADLTAKEKEMQMVIERFARNQNADDASTLKTGLLQLQASRASIIEQINFGKSEDWGLGFLCWASGETARCFHRNSSETNNFLIAVFSGMIGASIIALRTMSKPVAHVGLYVSSGELFGGIMLGGVVALLALFFIRGTKGVLLSPVGGVVEVENPYGIAFICTVIAIFSDRFLGMLDRWTNSLAQRRLGGEDGTSKNE